MNYFSIVSLQLMAFVVYALIGVIAVKVKLYDMDGLNVMSALIIKITLPIMIFTNTINGATKEDFMGSLAVLAATAVMYALAFLLCRCLAKLCKLSGNRKQVFTASSMFGNIGFMGIPIVAAVFPERGMLYIALFTVIDQLVLWTVGVNLTLPVEGANVPTTRQRIKKMINPNTIGITLAGIVIFTNLHLPQFLNNALVKVGAITSPLALIYLGGLFTYTKLFDYLKCKEFYLSILIKSWLFPILLFLIMSHFPGMTEETAVTMCLLSAMPTMNTIAMLAKSQKSDGEYSAAMTFVTTVCSLVTLPTVCLILQSF
ncbi:MAG: AEC family transporter [Dorea sp.]|nr:AEC family transporter [Dorea sp.]